MVMEEKAEEARIEEPGCDDCRDDESGEDP